MKVVAGFVAAVLLLAGCASTGNGALGTVQVAATHHPVASMGQRVSDWYSGVSGDFAAIQSDLGDVAARSSNADVAGVTLACQSLKDDARTLEGDPASPDPTSRTYLANALDYLSTSATECIAGDYTSSTADMNTGTVWIERISARIDQLTN